MRKDSFAISLVFHTLLVGTLVLLASIPKEFTPPVLIATRAQVRRAPKLVAPPLPVRRPKAAPDSGARGGGMRSPVPVSKGIPPRGPSRTFIPPAHNLRKNALTAPQIGFEDAPRLASGPLGDHSGVGKIPSLGGGLEGIGGASNRGVGHGPGGLADSGAGLGGRPSKWPQLLYKAEPEYSDTARQARHQGTVLLAVTVDAQGNPKNIRVIRGLGLGLDERAMEAVATWRFRPALLNGRPVAAPITVEVNFRLL